MSRFIIALVVWAVICGTAPMPNWMALVGGIITGYWFSPYWGSVK